MIRQGTDLSVPSKATSVHHIYAFAAGLAPAAKGTKGV